MSRDWRLLAGASRFGIPDRYGYVHTTAGVVGWVRRSICRHETRKLGLTDHVAVTTTFEVTKVKRLAVTDPQEPEQRTLF